jgi:hypothetical protein
MAVAMPFIYLGATLVSGALAVSQQRKSAGMQEIAFKEQAKQEETAARDREIERRRRLVSALASQNAEAGAFGLDPATGSRRAIQLEDARRANLDSLTDRAMTSRQAVTLRSQGRAARRQGNVAAGQTLLSTYQSTVQAG